MPIWFVDGAEALSPPAYQAITDAENDVLIGAVSAWEIAIKRSVGKLVPGHDYVAAVCAAGARELPITIAHAQAVGSLPLHHRDPFDRLLVAQAMAEDAIVVSGDPHVARYGVDVLW